MQLRHILQLSSVLQIVLSTQMSAGTLQTLLSEVFQYRVLFRPLSNHRLFQDFLNGQRNVPPTNTLIRAETLLPSQTWQRLHRM
jgi:hypothetical protein